MTISEYLNYYVATVGGLFGLSFLITDYKLKRDLAKRQKWNKIFGYTFLLLFMVPIVASILYTGNRDGVSFFHPGMIVVLLFSITRIRGSNKPVETTA